MIDRYARAFSAFRGARVQKIAQRLRTECSSAHVPDRVYAVDEIPYTLTGKKLEVPVRKILMGLDVAKSASRDATMNPNAIDYFIEFTEAQPDHSMT